MHGEPSSALRAEAAATPGNLANFRGNVALCAYGHSNQNTRIGNIGSPPDAAASLRGSVLGDRGVATQPENKSKKCLRNQNNAGNVRAHQPTRSATTTQTTMNFRPFTAHLPSLQREKRAAALRALRDAALRLDRTT